MINRPIYKFNLILIKYTPVVETLCYILYYTCTLCGYNVEWMKDIAKLTLFPLIYFLASSIVFRFCICHRMFLYYIVLCDVTTVYDRYFDEWIGVKEWCLAKIILGALLIGLLIGHLYHCENTLLKYKADN